MTTSLVAASSAQGAGADLGTVNGLNYQVNITSVASGTGLDTYAGCSGDDVAISGGIDIADDAGETPGIADGATMGSTYPGTDADLSVWRTSAVNESGETLDMSFYAICTEPEGVLTRKNKTKVEAGKKGKVRAQCPAGYEVAGGGIRSDGPLLASLPYDDDDKNKKPDDGWRASSYNGDTEKMTLTSFASCVRDADWDLSHLSRGAATEVGYTAYTSNECPEGAALAGLGARARGGEGPGDIRVPELYPLDDFFDEGEAPAEAMAAAIRAESDAIAGLRASAICRGPIP